MQKIWILNNECANTCRDKAELAKEPLASRVVGADFSYKIRRAYHTSHAIYESSHGLCPYTVSPKNWAQANTYLSGSRIELFDAAKAANTIIFNDRDKQRCPVAYVVPVALAQTQTVFIIAAVCSTQTVIKGLDIENYIFLLRLTQYQTRGFCKNAFCVEEI